jgi:hypothetical protein
MWLLHIFRPNIAAALAASPTAEIAFLAREDVGIFNSQVGFLLMICALDSTDEIKVTANAIIDRIARASAMDLSFPPDAEVNILIEGARGKRAGLLEIVKRIAHAKITEAFNFFLFIYFYFLFTIIYFFNSSQKVISTLIFILILRTIVASFIPMNYSIL